MSIDETARRLSSLAGVRGPMRSAEQDDEDRAALIAGQPLEAARRIIAVLERGAVPPDTPTKDVVMVAGDVLLELAVDAKVLQLLLDSLSNPAIRAAVLTALSLGGDVSASTALASVVRDGSYSQWSLDDVALLVAALGTVGGAEAKAAVSDLSSRTDWPPIVQEELEIASDYLYRQ